MSEKKKKRGYEKPLEAFDLNLHLLMRKISKFRILAISKGCVGAGRIIGKGRIFSGYTMEMPRYHDFISYSYVWMLIYTLTHCHIVGKSNHATEQYFPPFSTPRRPNSLKSNSSGVVMAITHLMIQ